MNKEKKNSVWKKIASLILTLVLLVLGVDNFTEIELMDSFTDTLEDEQTQVEENQSYDTAQEVVDYLYLYDDLPPNYITKKEAEELGWDASEGNLWEVAPDKSIGGDYFGNFEEQLPEEVGRDYHEADINYDGGYRGAERLVFSDDGLYFYTEDHYESFEKLVPEAKEE